jgi:hypothetical protein
MNFEKKLDYRVFDLTQRNTLLRLCGKLLEYSLLIPMDCDD